jgi:hypothetical protein
VVVRNGAGAPLFPEFGNRAAIQPPRVAADFHLAYSFVRRAIWFQRLPFRISGFVIL